MNHYRHHIGDYRKDTAHLSLLEHGIYRQALDLYYLEEQPLPIDRARLMRLLCVRNADEERSLCAVLADFFLETEEGYVHTRCERELEAIYAKSDKAKESARKRWDSKKQPVSGKKKRDDANALPPHSERNANGMLPSNPVTQYPVTQDPIKQEAETGRSSASDRFGDFWDAYPKKSDKKKAHEKWKAMRLDARADELIADVRKRIAKHRPWLDGYIPSPLRYLRDERFTDDIDLGPAKGKASADDHAERVRQELRGTQGQIIEGRFNHG